MNISHLFFFALGFGLFILTFKIHNFEKECQLKVHDNEKSHQIKRMLFFVTPLIGGLSAGSFMFSLMPLLASTKAVGTATSAGGGGEQTTLFSIIAITFTIFAGIALKNTFEAVANAQKHHEKIDQLIDKFRRENELKQLEQMRINRYINLLADYITTDQYMTGSERQSKLLKLAPLKAFYDTKINSDIENSIQILMTTNFRDAWTEDDSEFFSALESFYEGKDELKANLVRQIRLSH